MKVLYLLLLTLVLCSACSALPAEERAFAVALCVEKTDVWRVFARVPTYQSGGGYMTVTGEGDTFSQALSTVEAAAPMRINLSQLRLVTVDEGLLGSGELTALMSTLEAQPDMRMQCAIAVTSAAAGEVADALVPAAGARLSKALDLLLDARMEQGVILPAQLSDVIRMGERQSPILMRLSIEGQEIGLAGGCTVDGLRLSPEEIQLLSLLLGKVSSLRLNLPTGYAAVRDISAGWRLSPDFATARVELTMTATQASFTADGLEAVCADAILALLTRLSAAGCDALGLGRQAITQTRDMAAWHELDWRGKYRSIRWEVAVGVNGPA